MQCGVVTSTKYDALVEVSQLVAFDDHGAGGCVAPGESQGTAEEQEQGVGDAAAEREHQRPCDAGSAKQRSGSG